MSDCSKITLTRLQPHAGLAEQPLNLSRELKPALFYRANLPRLKSEKIWKSTGCREHVIENEVTSLQFQYAPISWVHGYHLQRTVTLVNNLGSLLA